MPKVRARIPVSVDVSDETFDLLLSLGQMVRTVREHALALKKTGESVRTFVAEADAILEKEKAKHRKKQAKRAKAVR